MPGREEMRRFFKRPFYETIAVSWTLDEQFCGGFGVYVHVYECVFFPATVLCGVGRLQRRKIESSHQIKMKCILLTLQNNQGISAGMRKVTQCAK